MSLINDLRRDVYVLRNYGLTRRRKPFLASYKLTYRCNLRCRQCPFPDLQGGDMRYDAVIATLDRLYERGDRLVIFEGGEPMLWRDGRRSIHDVVAEARRRFFCTGMTTNGTLPLDVATDILWVSVDGFAETHNRLRGADIFAQVIANARASRHPRLYAHLTANRLNAAELPDLVRFLADIFKGITVQVYYPYSRDDALFVPTGERVRLLERLIELKHQGYPLLNSIPALKALMHNTWRCADWLVDCANPDGTLWQGCYLKGRAEIDCARCGFSPYTEISLAHRGNIAAIQARIRIFF
jgi:MoaA/NifB/PqqE/SkfB family radical SAM enzyme